MKVSVEIPEHLVMEICRITGEQKKSVAIGKYVREVLNDLRRKEAAAAKAKISQKRRADEK